jgi:hypothetical protein
MSDQLNVVLVHGGFVDGSGRQGVYDLLTADGYRVSVVQNPTRDRREGQAPDRWEGQAQERARSRAVPCTAARLAGARYPISKAAGVPL